METRIHRIARDYLGRGASEPAAMLQRYVEELLRWNQGTNLISRRLDRPQVDRLILDSLALATLVPEEPLRCIDIGSGAGLPGMVLAMVRPDLEVHLVERRRKRTIFLEHLRDREGLADLVVHPCDLQDLLREESCTGTFHLVTLRAVGPVEGMMRAVAPLLRHGGTVLVLTGEGTRPDLEVERIPSRRCLPGAKGYLLRWRPARLPDVPRETGQLDSG